MRWVVSTMILFNAQHFFYYLNKHNYYKFLFMLKINTAIKNKIFIKNLNLVSKIKVIGSHSQDSRRIVYVPAYSKEWNSILYYFNKNSSKNVPVNKINLIKIINSYFNMCFKTNYFTESSYIPMVLRPVLLRNIHISKPEFKYTNDKVQVNIHTANIEKNELYNSFANSIFCNIQSITFWSKNLKLITFEFFNSLKSQNDLNKNEALKIYMSKYLFIKKKISKCIFEIRQSEYFYYLNVFKFDKEQFLDKLTYILNKILKKRIEYNIINVKTFSHNPEIFTNILALKLKKQTFNLVTAMEGLVRRLRIPTRMWDYEKNIAYITDIFANSYRNISILKIKSQKECIHDILKNIYVFNPIKNDKDFTLDVMGVIFRKLRLKHMLGIRVEVKGRLTKRYRADRAIYKLGWKGGLKNIASSRLKRRFNTYRGPNSSNTMYSITNSTRRIGAFAVKGWVSTKL
uniref:Ribosomal protein 3 n=1 Tax=Endoconidiophora resinifera TaxID=1580851 RepID=A0A3G6XM78_9PEZI|nr:ribosomal protein 3 [Endoconidiophora resinifera]AZL93781.1 ribosomal protein 3 [Endoconidiophora resinifera]AZL93795.1 ribosomal protein 3 [Endoconidiophora resinifera]AZL93809.1 ribosomal protein 3 [Endoconidiophora resinifera]